MSSRPTTDFLSYTLDILFCLSIQVLHCREKNLKVIMLKSGNNIQQGGKKSKDSKFLLNSVL